MASLFMIRGRDAGKHFTILNGRTTIGRDGLCDIQVTDHEVSRQHAEIERDDQQFTLIDLNSSNGSFVNGKRIEKNLLRSGDRLQFGRTLLVFTMNETEVLNKQPVDVDIVKEPSTNASQAEELSQIRHALPSFDSGSPHSLALAAESSSVNRVSIPESSEVTLGQPRPATGPAEAITETLQETVDRTHWEMMYRTVLAVSRTMDIDQLLQQILELIFQWVDCDRGCVMLTCDDTQELRPVARRNRSTSAPSHRIEISKTILDYVVSRQEGVLTSNANDDQRWQAGASIVGMGIREAICVPMQGRYGIVGAIYIDTSQTLGHFAETNGRLTFNEEHLKLMIAIGHQAALAVEDSFYYRGMVQAERLATMGQTIATLSHHIKNILQGIRGGSYLVEEGIKRSQLETIAKGWKIVDKNQDRIEALVMDMLSLSKERQPQFAPVDLRDLIDDCIELTESQARETRIHIQWQRPETEFSVVAESEGIHRAILNVLNNAVDALNETTDGRISVTLRSDAKQTIIDISDNGRGIAPEDLQRIFSLFESSKGSRGTGLGLPVSQKILREHNGDILVSSELNQGTCFSLVLPNHSDKLDEQELNDHPTIS
ncbi:MAG: ATP-binding protein [Pirellulaceae bacterium]|nr:ATP-binding protein [Pirellulaceae bacterium]